MYFKICGQSLLLESLTYNEQGCLCKTNDNESKTTEIVRGESKLSSPFSLPSEALRGWLRRRYESRILSGRDLEKLVESR